MRWQKGRRKQVPKREAKTLSFIDVDRLSEKKALISANLLTEMLAETAAKSCPEILNAILRSDVISLKLLIIINVFFTLFYILQYLKLYSIFKRENFDGKSEMRC